MPTRVIFIDRLPVSPLADAAPCVTESELQTANFKICLCKCRKTSEHYHQWTYSRRSDENFRCFCDVASQIYWVTS